MSVQDLSISDKRQIKKILRDAISKFTIDPDYPMPDLGEGILKDWSKDITNYYDLIDAYLFKKTRDKSNYGGLIDIVDIVIEGIFPYVMAFQDFFTRYYIKDNVTKQCDKNNVDESDNTKKIGPILFDNLQNGTTFKLSDGYCYDLMELYGIQSSNERFISPLTREDFDFTEQVFLTIIKSLNSNQISLLNANSPVAGLKYNKRKQSKARKNNATKRNKQRKSTKKSTKKRKLR